jgi:NACalpha-BTF3-like transcription factor/glycosyltransferase involved in cell wall biosynthesis
MGNKKPTKKSKSSTNSTSNDSDLLPFVSICTPTYNRRPFFPMAIECFNNYDYPKDRMEWIIVDDGSDSVEDLVKDIPQVRYFREEKQMVLGRKRNYMHEKAKGDIIVYQDDDDYYPPDRVSHAVEKLMSDPKVMAGGSTVLFLYFKHIQQMYRFGPYSQNHATAGTFAFKRELLKETKYDDFKALAEEKDFLKGYTVPFIQFDPLKSILVFSHNHNTFDKKKLLAHAPNPTCNPDMNITIEHIMKSESAKKFFLEDIDGLLAEYEPGDIKNKPEVLNQTKLIEESREKQMVELQELRRETMARDDIRQFQSEMNQQLSNMKRDMSRVFEVNKRLVQKMKEIKHLLTEEDKKLMDETDKAPPICNVAINNPVLRVIQTDAMVNVDPKSVQNIFSFIENHEMSLVLEINDTEKIPVSFKCGLEFNPHPSVQHLYLGNNSTNQIDLNKALGGQQPANVNEEDVKTIMEQTECNRATAVNALGKEGGDVISCIMNIDTHKCDDVPTTPSPNFSEDDITTIMEQTECNRATAMNALGKEGGDVIACIMNIDSHKCDDDQQPSETSITIAGQDIDTLKNKTGCNEMTAIQALANEKNNVENAILNIKKYTVGAEENAQFLKNVAPPINPGPNEDDIATIIDQTGCDKETAVNALKGENNDVISCIMNIDNYKVDSNQESEEGVTLSVSE